MAELFDNAELAFAAIANDSDYMDRLAEDFAERVRGFIAPHRDDTDGDHYADSIHVGKAESGRHGVGHDRVIYSDDPLAVVKEFGHVVVSHGEIAGFVPGILAFRKAINSTPEVE